MIKQLFSKQWIFATILVIAGVAVLARLGMWQRDRLIQRREFNQSVQTQIDAGPIVLDSSSVDFKLSEFDFREVSVTGEFLLDQQMLLRNQINDKDSGYHLLTPLSIQGSDSVVVVDRGWIPLDDKLPEDWRQYDIEGQVTIVGVIRKSQNESLFNIEPDNFLTQDESWRQDWRMVHLEAISGQIENILMIYVQETPDEKDQTVPIATKVELDLTEGPHADYAAQWFAFALMLGIGYPFYVKNQSKETIQESVEQ